MQRAHLDFDPVLLAAKDMGYAEADPSADIDGEDVVNKLKISAAPLHNMAPPRDVPTLVFATSAKPTLTFRKSTSGFTVDCVRNVNVTVTTIVRLWNRACIQKPPYGQYI